MRILVAMSGGVDSTVTAHLLKKEGHEVIGVNFNFTKAKNNCKGEFYEPACDRRGKFYEPACDRRGEFYEPACDCRGEFYEPELQEISEKLGIKIIYRDYAQEFHDKIIKYFVTEYENGRTPNPCALCNPTMKFAKLLQVMKEENCDMVATGHYANITTIGASIASPIRYSIKKSKNQQKDQSYMLYRLSQDQLSHIIFPLSDMDKSDVRKIAAELGLKVADKKDSQDVCFVGTNNSVGVSSTSPQLVGVSTASSIDYKEFIKRYEFGPDYREKIARGQLKEEDILSKPYFRKGEFVDINGRVLGFHDGIINYTVGQRKGFNIAFGERRFAVKIDAKKNQVVLGSNDDLMSSKFKIKDVVFSGHDENVIGKKFYAKLRYRHDGTLCEIIGCEYDEIKNLVLTCQLESPVRAITPGQSAVFYDEEDRVMLGGIIL